MQGGQSATENQTETVSTDLKQAINAGFDAEVGTKPEHFFGEMRPQTRNLERFQTRTGGGERIRTAASRFCRPLP